MQSSYYRTCCRAHWSGDADAVGRTKGKHERLPPDFLHLLQRGVECLCHDMAVKGSESTSATTRKGSGNQKDGKVATENKFDRTGGVVGEVELKRVLLDPRSEAAIDLTREDRQLHRQ